MIYTENIKEKVSAEMNLLVEIIKKTLGPNSLNIIITNNEYMKLSSDGLNIIKSIKTNNIYTQVALNYLISAAMKTKEDVGDNTTQTMIILNELIKNLKDIPSSIDYITPLNNILNTIYEVLEKQSFLIKDNDLIKVAYTACNNYQLAEVISQIVSKIGKYGYVFIRPSYNHLVEYLIDEGIAYDKGYVSSFFSVNDKVILNEATVLILNDEITKISELEDLISEVKSEFKDLLIIALNYSKEVIDYMIYLRKSYNFNICATKAPEYGELTSLFLDDLATYLDSHVITNKNAYNKYKSNNCYIEVSKNHTLIKKKDLNMERINKRINVLKEDILNTKNEKSIKRLAKLTNSIATLFIPYNNDYEYEILKEKASNAISSCLNSLDSFCLSGSGNGLYKVYLELIDKYLDSNFEYLIYNKVIKSLDIIKKLINKDNPDIIDPLVQVKSILKNSFEVLKLFLSTEVIIENKINESASELFC